MAIALQVKMMAAMGGVTPKAGGGLAALMGKAPKIEEKDPFSALSASRKKLVESSGAARPVKPLAAMLSKGRK
jgi:hypothetical protein